MKLGENTMNVSVAVAYRIYHLESQTLAIAFNTETQKFMFLDGLSAELLELILEGHSCKTNQWLKENQLTEDSVTYFKHQISNFGFFNSLPNTKHAVITSDLNLAQEELKYENMLNIFQNTLRKNGLYYCFHIDLTNRCNEKCIHCYHPFSQYDYSKELSLQEIKKLIDMLYDLGVFSVTLSGGECLLRNDFFDILSYISEKGMMATIFTNGVLLTEKTVQQIKKHRVKIVSISIYGNDAESHDNITGVNGSFEQTLEGIALLKRYHVPFELKSVILAENIDRIEEIRSLSKRINDGKDCKTDFSLCGRIDGNCEVFTHQASLKSIKQVLYSDPEHFFSAGKYDSYKKSSNDSPCGAGKYGLYCSAEGNIYPCVSFRLLLCHYTELPQIAQNGTLHRWLNTKISDFSDCFNHDYCAYCTEQCAGNNLIENGNYLDSAGISNCERAKIIAEWFETHSE